MINRRPYIAESAIKPGCAVVQGSADNKVKAPNDKGEGDYIGIYPYEANEEKKPDEAVGIVLYGVAKALAGGTVSAGKKAVLKKDASGSLVVALDPPKPSPFVGTFLESGEAGDYVDVMLEQGLTVKE